MKIAQVAPIWLRVPPVGYGGAEQVISLLTEELVLRGHEVTLFASGDSDTKAKLVSVVDKAPGLNRETMANIVNNMNHMFNMFNVLDHAKEFDLIHWHISKDISPLMYIPYCEKPSLVTIHNHYPEYEMSGLGKIIDYYKDIKYFVSISDSHRKYFPFNFKATVYNGIDLKLFDYNEKPQKYFAWIGRFAGDKGPHLAIQVALKLGVPLKIAAPKDENPYFKEKIEPFLGKDGIDYIGEVDPQERNKLLKNALAFLNPIQWDEPFGLVVPEANACGTPVVAFSRGAMPELIQEGKNGFLAEPNDLENFIEKTREMMAMNEDEIKSMRQFSRHLVEERFTLTQMANGYEKVYQEIIEEKAN